MEKGSEFDLLLGYYRTVWETRDRIFEKGSVFAALLLGDQRTSPGEKKQNFIGKGVCLPFTRKLDNKSEREEIESCRKVFQHFYSDIRQKLRERRDIILEKGSVFALSLGDQKTSPGEKETIFWRMEVSGSPGEKRQNLREKLICLTFYL